MNVPHSLALIAVIAAVTAALRFLPFLLFPAGKPLPPVLMYMGKVLPGATMGMLLVYCLRNTKITQAPHGIPELIACALTACVYLWKRNVLASIVTGTAVYMILVQVVF